MTTTKHIATLDGQTFTRSSKSRVYTHCVVAKPSYAKGVRRMAEAADLHKANFRYYTKAHHHAELAGDDEQAYVARKIAEGLEYIEARREAGFYDTWQALSWSSRRDLAEKIAATARNSAYWGAVEILEATHN